MKSAVFDQLHTILSTTEDRTRKAERIAKLLREVGNYRWVGLYKVDDHEIAIIALSGPNVPTYPRFPMTQGLSGETVVVGNVKTDPRYLTTFGTTLSEMIIPIKYVEFTGFYGDPNYSGEPINCAEATGLR